MSTRQETQGSRRSARLNKSTTPEPTSNGSGMVSGSPTPTWSHGASPVHSHDDDAGPGDGQLEEDVFMPTAQEVAETLAGMRSRGDNRDRGHEVCCVQLEDGTSVQRLIAGAIYTETDKRNTRLDGIWFSSRLLLMRTHHFSCSPCLTPLHYPNWEEKSD